MKTNVILILAISMILCMTQTISAQRIFKVTEATAAQVKVAVVTDESQADLKVIEVSQGEEVVKDGTWFITPSENEADLKVFITTDASQADVKIFYVTNAEQAGWITRDKRHFFKSQK
jgi:hypothetical protein